MKQKFHKGDYIQIIFAGNMDSNWFGEVGRIIKRNIKRQNKINYDVIMYPNNRSIYLYENEIKKISKEEFFLEAI
jgi:hypothetical protein